MRAYHRVDPLMDERKGHYTPAQFGAFLKVQLVAGRQSYRGRFRSLAALKNLLPAAYVKFVDFLVTEGDIDVLADGTVYVDGWDEWQEGDLTVRDRMARLRNRKRNGTVTATVTPTVTEPSPTAIRVGVGIGVGDDGANAPSARDGLPNLDDEAVTFLEGMTKRNIRAAGDKQLAEYDRQIADHGLPAVIAAYRKAAKTLPVSPPPTARQLVWAGMKVLEPIPTARDANDAARRQDEAEDRQRRSRKAQEETWQRRRDWFARTGQWDEAWGPRPESAA